MNISGIDLAPIRTSVEQRRAAPDSPSPSTSPERSAPSAGDSVSTAARSSFSRSTSPQTLIGAPAGGSPLTPQQIHQIIERHSANACDLGDGETKWPAIIRACRADMPRLPSYARLQLLGSLQSYAADIELKPLRTYVAARLHELAKSVHFADSQEAYAAQTQGSAQPLSRAQSASHGLPRSPSSSSGSNYAAVSAIGAARRSMDA